MHNRQLFESGSLASVAATCNGKRSDLFENDDLSPLADRWKSDDADADAADDCRLTRPPQIAGTLPPSIALIMLLVQRSLERRCLQLSLRGL